MRIGVKSPVEYRKSVDQVIPVGMRSRQSAEMKINCFSDRFREAEEWNCFSRNFFPWF